MMVYCVFTLKSPHQGDSNENTQYTIYQYEKEKLPKLSQICSYGIFSRDSRTCSKGDSNENTQYTIYQYEKEKLPKLSQICSYGIFFKGLKNVFERAVVNEPSVFEPLKFYCIYQNQRKPHHRSFMLRK